MLCTEVTAGVVVTAGADAGAEVDAAVDGVEDFVQVARLPLPEAPAGAAEALLAASGKATATMATAATRRALAREVKMLVMPSVSASTAFHPTPEC